MDSIRPSARFWSIPKALSGFPALKAWLASTAMDFTCSLQPMDCPTRALSAVLERRDGTYWVAGGEQLCLFDPRPDRTRFQCESPKLGAIRSLLEDEQGLWCGSDRGLWRRAAGGEQSWKSVRGLEPVPTGRSIRIGKLLKDTRGDVWASTFFGLYRFRLNGRVERWTHAQGLEMDQGTALAETPGSIWAGSQRELIRFQIDPSSGAAAIANRYSRPHGLPSGYVCDVRSWRGQVWAATFQGLARQLPSGAWRTVQLDPSVRGFPLGPFATDTLGNLWAGTDGGGAVRISGSGLSSFSERDGLVVENVWAVFEDRQRNLMAVTKDEDHYFLNRFDGYGFHPVRPNAPFRIGFSWSWPHIAAHSRSGDWWLATGAGLLRYTHGLEAAPSLAAEAATFFSVFEDSRGAIWVRVRALISGNDLYRRHAGAGRVEKFGEADGLPPLHLEQNVPSAFAEDRNGAVWIGMLNGGLVRFRNGRFQQFAPSSGAPGRGVRALLVDGQGRLWIGTNGHGLLRIDDPSAASPTFFAYTKASGLSSDTIHALADDLDGRIYAAAGSSIDRIDPSGSPGSGWIRKFTAEDGLLPAEPPGGFQGPAWRAMVWRRPWPAPNRATKGCLDSSQRSGLRHSSEWPPASDLCSGRCRTCGAIAFPCRTATPSGFRRLSPRSSLSDASLWPGSGLDTANSFSQRSLSFAGVRQLRARDPSHDSRRRLQHCAGARAFPDRGACLAALVVSAPRRCLHRSNRLRRSPSPPAARGGSRASAHPLGGRPA